MKTKIRAEAALLIRAKIADVFNSFTEPKQLCRFWLSQASAPLRKGARVEWTFLVPGARDEVRVMQFRKNQRLTLRWSDGTTTEMRFRRHTPKVVHVAVTTFGFNGRHAAAQAVTNTEGFAIVLCDLKSLLETGRSGAMVRDKAALITSQMKK